MSPKIKGFILNIAPLAHGQHSLQFNPTPESLGLSDAEFGQIEVQAQIDLRKDKTAETALVQFTTDAVAHLVCDRTLVPFDEQVKGRYTVFFTDDEAESGEEEEIYPLPPNQLLDLTEVVRDTILLSVPIRKIAPDVADQDIPLVFGADEEEGNATDRRWDVLKNLKFDE